MEMFNPHSNEWLQNKFDYYKQLRTRDTAYWSEKYQMYVITKYDDVLFALSNPEIFSSAKGNLIVEDPDRFGRTLGASDHPRHTFFKSIVKDAYSKENIERIDGAFSSKVRELLSGQTKVNISDLIDHMTAWGIAEVLNFPTYDKEYVHNIIVQFQRHGMQCVSENVDQSTYTPFKTIISTLINETGVVPPDGPGIYKSFIENNPELRPVWSLFTGPIISGASSLTGALQFLTLDLYRENQLKTLIADRELIPKAVNESLRFNSSTGRFSRTVVQPIMLHGVQLNPGDRVALCLESANRDPLKFQNPDVFDLDRDTSGHLAFGYGPHACIAMAISKAVMKSYLTILLDVFGEYRITTPNEDMKYVMTRSGNDDMISNLMMEKV